MDKKALIINELRVKNVGPIKEIHVIPQGDVIELTGPNGAGKTFALDSMAYALSGAKSFNDIPKLIRNGEDSAEVFVDLGQYKILREWRGEHNYVLKVTRKLEDGVEVDVKAPQSVLDAFGKTIGVDPLELSEKRAANLRKEFLLGFVEIDLEALDVERQGVYNERTETNRRAKELRAVKSQLPPIADELPELVNVENEMNALNKAQEHNAKVSRAKEKAEGIDDEIQEAKDEVARLEVQLKAAKAEVKAQEKRKADSKKWLKDNPRVDTEPINEKIRKAQHIKEQHQIKAKHEEADESIKTLESKSEKLTKKLQGFENKKEKAIKAAKLPLEGLSISEADVTINGQAFSQYSEGERLKYAALMLIGSNPRFKVLGIKEGEKLDSKNMKALKDVAREHGFQLWIEKMDESGEIGFVFKDGEIVKQN